MIDWLNVVIGSVFAFAGVSILISALRYYLQTSFGKYMLAAAVGLAFFIIGGNLILNSSITFDSALHECTEWNIKKLSEECFAWDDKELPDYCVPKYDVVSCVSFRAKTECEKGNPEYILEKGRDWFLINTTFIDGYDFLCENCTDEETLKKGSEGLNKIYRYVGYGNSPDICRKKSVEELEVDYCRENPEEGTFQGGRCYCSNRTPQIGYYEQGKANYSAYNFTMDTKSWFDWQYGRSYFIPPPVNSFDVVDYSDCQSILGLTNVSTSCVAWNITQIPVYYHICVSAVPVSEKNQAICKMNGYDYYAAEHDNIPAMCCVARCGGDIGCNSFNSGNPKENLNQTCVRAVSKVVLFVNVTSECYEFDIDENSFVKPFPEGKKTYSQIIQTEDSLSVGEWYPSVQDYKDVRCKVTKVEE